VRRVTCDWGAYLSDGRGIRLTLIGLVVEGATTPWSWASLPGRYLLSRGYTYCLGVSGLSGRMPWGWDIATTPTAEPLFLTSTRLEEPLSPEAQALVEAARGAR
jgi:hypothetical protein